MSEIKRYKLGVFERGFDECSGGELCFYDDVEQLNRNYSLAISLLTARNIGLETLLSKTQQVLLTKIARIKELGNEIEKLQWVCSEAYQLAGAYGADVKAMDNLSAAANGDKLPHDSFLPVFNRCEAELTRLREQEPYCYYDLYSDTCITERQCKRNFPLYAEPKPA